LIRIRSGRHWRLPDPCGKPLRFAQLTKIFTKKSENHELPFGVSVAWYNFARPSTMISDAALLVSRVNQISQFSCAKVLAMATSEGRGKVMSSEPSASQADEVPASETDETSSPAKENAVQEDVGHEYDDQPEPRTPIQRLLWWTGFIAVDLEVLVVLAYVLKVVRWRGNFEPLIQLSLLGVIGACWVLLQWSYGTLGVELKKFVTGNGKNFRSDSSLSPFVQVLVIVVVLLVGGLGFYLCAWYVKH
jgi:hypothetical protein